MSGYTTSDVVELLGITAARVRHFVHQGFVEPQRGARGAFQFSFQDLVLMRTAKELADARVPPRRVAGALRYLRDTLPNGKSLSTVRIGAHGDRVVVRDGDTAWHPESGQMTFDFSLAELVSDIAPLVRKAAAEARAAQSLDSEDWFDLALDLEAVGEVARAKEAYREALRANELNADAHINIGRLQLESGDATGAERHFRSALAARPDDAIGNYNIALALEELKRDDEALLHYQRAVKLDPAFADAHYNLAILYERDGNDKAALRHLSRYRSLTGTR
ncbi:MAG: tetratricopeptide repeat protein [Gammaproteobacteria bacterium]|nr:tetratricopeptide repeat protein [Gammaproteobacteria bacterium]